MQDVLNRSYKGLLNAIDSFANSSTSIQYSLSTNKKSIEKPNYVYAEDNYLDAVLNNPVTFITLRTIANRLYGKQIEEIILNSTQLSKDNYPELWESYRHCCSVLGIERVPALYITTRLKGINALSVEVDKEQIILLSLPAVVMLEKRELRFLLGHELGHIQQGHLIAHTVQGLLEDLNKRVELLGPVVTDILDVPLNRWYRTSELTADRAGFLCCQDMDVIVGLFKRLGLEASESPISRLAELSHAHPLNSTRLEKLHEYKDELQNLAEYDKE